MHSPTAVCPSCSLAQVHNLMAPDKLAEMVSAHKQSHGNTSPCEEENSDNERANDDDPNPNGTSRLKVLRHNMTERRRVDRMNQLFKKLYYAIEDTAPPRLTNQAGNAGTRLTVCGADGKLINPNKWSKADVLEGALNIIPVSYTHLTLPTT